LNAVSNIPNHAKTYHHDAIKYYPKYIIIYYDDSQDLMDNIMSQGTVREID